MSNRFEIVARIRPLSNEEVEEEVESDSVIEISCNRLRISSNSKICTNYVFSNVLGSESSQKELFEYIFPTLLLSRKRSNVSIISYGHTGSGKSYSIFGDLALKENINEENYGLVPRTMKWLTEEVMRSTKIHVCFMQIYNDKLFDLLSDRRSNTTALEVREPSTGVILVPNLKKVSIANFPEALKVIKLGCKARYIANTSVNRCSSRAHTIFQIILDGEDIDDNRKEICTAIKINFVDLAGSERWKIFEDDRSASHALRMKELTSINRSLSCLGKCINALAMKKTHVPYRDSMLTRLLRDALEGAASRTVFVVTLAPSRKYLSETSSTLCFTDRLMAVQEAASVEECSPAAAAVAKEKEAATTPPPSPSPKALETAVALLTPLHEAHIKIESVVLSTLTPLVERLEHYGARIADIEHKLSLDSIVSVNPSLHPPSSCFSDYSASFMDLLQEARSVTESILQLQSERLQVSERKSQLLALSLNMERSQLEFNRDANTYIQHCIGGTIGGGALA